MSRSIAPKLTIALAVASGFLGACSPAGERATPANQPTRDVQMVEPVAPAAVISDLEAGRPLKATTPRPRTPAPVTQPEALTAEPAPEVSTIEAPAPALVEAPAPVAAPAATSGPSADEVVFVSAAAVQPTYAIDLNPPISPRDGRGPMIIRGGRGGIHDDCDLHRPGINRIPAAVNRFSSPGSGWQPPASRGAGIR